MIIRIFAFCLVAALSALSGFVSPSLAMTPGYVASHWTPSDIQQLNTREARALIDKRCQVVSFRYQGREVPKRESGKLDEHDKLSLVRGEFAVRGQRDAAVLCRFPDESMHIVFIWAGPAGCPGDVAFNKISRFMSEHPQPKLYYGAELSVWSPSEAAKRTWERYSRSERNRDNEIGVVNRAWVYDPKVAPKLEHDSFVLMASGPHSYDVALYCRDGKWTPLLEVYRDLID